jgi:hypothetical protein
MKHLLSGTALSIALAFTAPVWAQAPAPQYPSGTPSQPGTYTQPPSATYRQKPPVSAPAPSPYAQQPTPSAAYAEQPPEPPDHRGMYGHPKRYTGYKRRMHRPRYGHAGGRGPSDNVANQLNRQELSQLYGAGMPPGAYAPRGPAPQGYPPPRY